MYYPLISEYIEAIKSAEDNFKELSYLRPVLGNDGLPVMTSGNFAVVFKMKDEKNGKFYAVKCFTKEQEGRTEAYREIAKELKDVSSPYLVSIQYLEKELFVDTDQTSEAEFPILLMDWVEGKTLDKYLHENLDDKYTLEMLTYRFSQLAQWLIPQPFAHGDLKPDNILVREDGTLILVDYDGMYVPAMKGQKARELGSPDFRHPQRTEDDFDEYIDDFSLVSILLSLKSISFNPLWLDDFCSEGRLLFANEDYTCLETCPFCDRIFPSTNNHINSLFFLLLQQARYPKKFDLDRLFVFRLGDLTPFDDYELEILAINYTVHNIEHIKSFSNYVQVMIDIFGNYIISHLKSYFASVLLYPGINLSSQKIHQLYEEIDKFDVGKFHIVDQIKTLNPQKGYAYKNFLNEFSKIYWDICAKTLKEKGIEKAEAEYELSAIWNSGYVYFKEKSPYSNSAEKRIEIWEFDCNYNWELTAYSHYQLDILKDSALFGHIGAQFELANIYRYNHEEIRNIRKSDEWEKLARFNLYLKSHSESHYSQYSYRTESGIMKAEQIEKL